NGSTAMPFSGITAIAAASGDFNSLISSGASWRDKLQIPKPIASATAAVSAVVKAPLLLRLESKELALPGNWFGISGLGVADFSPLSVQEFITISTSGWPFSPGSRERDGRCR